MDSYKKTTSNAVRMQAEVCNKQQITELNTDISLPDYLPQIKRLLRVRASVCPPDKYIGAGNAEFSGHIDYTILYSGNDGALYAATEGGDYRFGVPLEAASDFELNEGLTCDIDCLPDTVIGRVVAPRRLSIKCRLRSHVRIWGTKFVEEQLTGSEHGSPERLCGLAEIARCFSGLGDSMTLGDEIILDSDAQDLRVIHADAAVFVTEATAGSGNVSCRGELCLELLCCHENAPLPPFSLRRRIPFSQSVPCDGVEVNCDSCADGTATDLHISVEEGRILCEAAVTLRVRAQRNETISYTRDLYSTTATSETRVTPCKLPHAERCLNGNFSLNTTLSLEEAGMRPGQTPIDIALTPTAVSVESENGKTTISGKCRASTILYDGEDLTAQEFEVPFRYQTDGASVSDSDAVIEPISCRARVDGERIALDAELAVALMTRSATEVCMLTEANFGEALRSTGACMTVCFPSRDDTLWSIAKRYHRPVSEISKENHLAAAPAADAPDSLAGVSYLVV